MDLGGIDTCDISRIQKKPDNSKNQTTPKSGHPKQRQECFNPYPNYRRASLAFSRSITIEYLC